MKKLTIVIPVYFNQDSLPLLFEKLLDVEQQLNDMGIELELIFVDDGSRDNSFQELMKIKRKREATLVIKLTRNFGADHAYKTGLQFVTGDCFVILSADLQDPPDLVIEMAKRWVAGSKFVICERISRDDPLLSKIYAFFLLSITSFVSYERLSFWWV